MTITQDLSTLILPAVAAVQDGAFDFKEIYQSDAPIGKNEFLFFIKPEMTRPSHTIQFNKILTLIEEKMEEFKMTIHNVKVLSANYLKEYNIIAQHYGVINKIAANAVANMSEGAKENFQEIFGLSVNEAKVLGGIEFLEQYPSFTPDALDFLLQNTGAQKLAGGTYCAKIKLDSETVYLVNGFHPRQLEQFTAAGRSIVVMTLSSDLSWKDARTKFIGATNPEQAAEGSLRRSFLEQKEILGLDEVSQGANGVHLSAGPVEGLIELRRYNTNFAGGLEKQFTDFSFGQALEANFTTEQFNKIVDNENVEVNGKSESIFDLTEEMDATEALDYLKGIL